MHALWAAAVREARFKRELRLEETLFYTAIALGGLLLLAYFSRRLMATYGLDTPHAAMLNLLGDLWAGSVVILAVHHGGQSVLEYLGLSRPTLQAIGIGIGAQCTLEIIPIGLRLMAFYGSCGLITGCPSISFNTSALARTDFAAWSTVIIMAPVCEEIVVRGFLYSGLVRSIKSPFIAIGITALVFTLMHVDVQLHPSGFRVLWLLGSGLLYGFLRWKTGSLWPSITAHVVGNLIAIMSMSYAVIR